MFRVIERKVGEPDFTEHCLLERGPHEGIELAMPACQGGEEDSYRLIVELVCEYDFSAVLDYRLVVPCVNSTSYFQVIEQTEHYSGIVFLPIKANLRVS